MHFSVCRLPTERMLLPSFFLHFSAFHLPLIVSRLTPTPPNCMLENSYRIPEFGEQLPWCLQKLDVIRSSFLRLIQRLRFQNHCEPWGGTCLDNQTRFRLEEQTRFIGCQIDDSMQGDQPFPHGSGDIDPTFRRTPADSENTLPLLDMNPQTAITRFLVCIRPFRNFQLSLDPPL